MNGIVLFMIAAVLVPIPAFAGSIYKTEPTTEAEKAVGKVLEALDSKRRANDARGASELYSEKAVMKFYWGSQDELKVMEGRLKIYVALSSATLQKAELYDVIIKVGGDSADATGRMKTYINAFGSSWLKEPEVKWQLRLENGQWLISSEEQSRVMAVRQ